MVALYFVDANSEVITADKGYLQILPISNYSIIKKDDLGEQVLIIEQIFRTKSPKILCK